jgi:hypothetical protein
LVAVRVLVNLLLALELVAMAMPTPSPQRLASNHVELNGLIQNDRRSCNHGWPTKRLDRTRH